MKISIMKFTIIIPIFLLAISCIKPVDTSPRIAPADADADYCLDLRVKPKAILVKKYRDLEPALLNIQKKPYFKCKDEGITTNSYFYFFREKEEDIWVLYEGSRTFIHIIDGGDDDIIEARRPKISPVVQIDFPESQPIALSIERKKEDLLQFKNKIIDAKIFKNFNCEPDVDTTLSIEFRARITGECENLPQLIWNIGATSKDSVIAELSSDGTLFIRGNGKMMDFDKPDYNPWGKICSEEITKVVIENGVTHIGNLTLMNCYYLNSITIPSSVVSIGEWAFAHSGTSFDHGYEYFLSIVASIGKSTFHSDGLISTTISDSITSITIPSDEKDFRKDQFSKFKNISSITTLNPVPPKPLVYHFEKFEPVTFNNVNKETCPLYVPKGSVDAYRKAEGWREFKNIMTIGDTVSAESPMPAGPRSWLQLPWNIGATAKDSVIAELSSEKTLAIRGIGKMMDFDFSRDRPWYRICNEKITKVVIDSGVTSIGNKAFMSCDSLTSITIPGSVTSIGDYAFYESRLSSITIPSSVTYIGNEAFEGIKLTSIAIPGNVTYIGKGAFSWSKLASITISGKVTSIEDETFAYCKLRHITIPGSVTSIGKEAFNECKKLRSITVSNPVPPSLFDDGYMVFGDVNRETCILYVPKGSVDAYRKAEGWGEFKNIMPAGNAVLAEPPISAGPRNWQQPPWNIGATAKDSVIAELSSDGVLAIRGIGKMMDFDSWSDRPWNRICDEKNTKITKVVIDSGVTSIGDGAFMDCNNLTSIAIPGSVTSIGAEAFEHSRNLKSIAIPSSVTSIGDYAFSWSGLTSIAIPGNVTYIGKDAFSWSKLASITIPSSVTSIGNRAFSNSKLASITIPSSVTSIGGGAFAYCSNLRTITIPGKLTTIGNYAFGNSGLDSITIPDSVTHIGSMAFHRCYNLRSITIPSKVTTIGNYAFSSSKLTSITTLNPVPPKLLVDYCDDLQPDTFKEVNKDTCTLYVPKGSVDAYRKAEGWKEFKNIKPIENENK